jgi:hypothetical protein
MVAVRSRLLPPEVREAWAQYLEDLRRSPAGSYPEVEPWAWQRLQAKLSAYRKKRA